MRAKKTAKPTRPAKAKPVEIEGHLMPPAIHAQFESNFKSRSQQEGLPFDQQFSLALSDTVYKHKPHARAKEICYSFHSMVSDCGMGLGTLAEWPWFCRNNFMRQSGCDLLATIASQLEATARQVREYRDALVEEKDGHLQDWLKLDARLNTAGQEPASQKRR